LIWDIVKIALPCLVRAPGVSGVRFLVVLMARRPGVVLDFDGGPRGLRWGPDRPLTGGSPWVTVEA